MTTQLTFADGTEVSKGDTVVIAARDSDGEEIRTELTASGGFRDAEKLVVALDGRAIGSLKSDTPIGCTDDAVIGALSLDGEEGVVREVTAIEVA